MKCLFLILSIFSYTVASAQTWVDTLDNSLRKIYVPASAYGWTWQNAPILHAMEFQYNCMPESKKSTYFNYIENAMGRNVLFANGAFPNAVASGMGMAFLKKHSDEDIFEILANQIFYDYRNSRRTSNNGISHLKWSPELWDDTIYMIGMYLIGMYNATEDEKYLNELIEQIRAHKEKLIDEVWGLWVHGWDDNNTFTYDFCSQTNWADPVTRRSSEIWGRGNGWVIVTISELLNVLDRNHPEWNFVKNSLVEMIQHLPEQQDEATGHWYQLPTKKDDPNNYIESSCTAMFAYGMLNALQLGIVDDERYETAVTNAYYGLRKHSVFKETVAGNEYYSVRNVAQETCLGDADYYFNIPSGDGTSYAFAVFILLGRAYEKSYLNGVPTAIKNSNLQKKEWKLYPSLIGPNGTLTIENVSLATNAIKIEMINPLGQVVLRKDNISTNPHSKIEVNLNNVSTGKYFIVLKGEEGDVYTHQSIVVH